MPSTQCSVCYVTHLSGYLSISLLNLHVQEELPCRLLYDIGKVRTGTFMICWSDFKSYCARLFTARSLRGKVGKKVGYVAGTKKVPRKDLTIKINTENIRKRSPKMRGFRAF